MTIIMPSFLGHDGTFYVGVNGGILAMGDGE
jgi:hypothetical protein